MATKTRDIAFELKSLKEDGSFEGYGSVFGVKDSYDEIVAAGAFTESLASHKNAGTMPALLWQHRSGEPIGVYLEMKEDNIGLKVTGQLALKTTRGAEAYELLKIGAITGLSIGFVTREDSYDRVTGIRTLKKVDLWEVSLVTFPANDAARIQGVKSIEQLEDLKSAEQYLRDAGLSRTEAKAFVARVKCLGQSDSDGGELQQIREALSSRGAVFAAT
ncbi:HK97 family phage prohead protease [Massilia sp. TS11]|uniref:HK97 family phage prohead protease n=1 Tax=Massilia sp. TS11 TaxID=2908003 RepID=UPI001EDB43F3|nr:HK97 family phage prohead protease [Massilia sp. TS11]MCG2586501.1 HK97 family phage prohead protease [Massilia sp. TS11]